MSRVEAPPSRSWVVYQHTGRSEAYRVVVDLDGWSEDPHARATGYRVERAHVDALPANLPPAARVGEWQPHPSPQRVLLGALNALRKVALAALEPAKDAGDRSRP